MTSNLRSKFHLVIGLTGTLVFCSGVFILASGIVVRDLLDDMETFYGYGGNTCQYWAGIPTILTGSILVLAVVFNSRQFLKYISLCAVLITMVLTMGVIMEESVHASSVNYHSRKDSFICGDLEDSNMDKESLHKRKKDCLNLKLAAPWYYIMVFAADITFVLCSLVALILFIDWVLFVAPRTPHNNLEMAYQLPPESQRGYSDFQRQTWSNT
ncbi:uncharacterized protein LOC114521723 [Dendronephthya gigantea]|uniref:uncharacterized protein LOC114521723 n=1 Tax=Dendronephthya gigantea TaxID=151771 RepID=UPI00106C4B65|nr:uncharacterized protein LOC114521723 [Dendronephthya gigantea]